MKKDATYYAFLPIAILYFFFNNAFLPHGLLFTMILSPVFIYWLYKQGKLMSWLKWSLLLLIPVPFHILTGFEIRSYLISTTLVFSAWLFLFTALEALSRMRGSLEDIFNKALAVNSFLILLAILFLPFTRFRGIFWYMVPISENIPAFPRLKLLAYEPSHYALLMSPVLIYFLIRIISGKSKHPLLLLAGVLLPLALSLSFGVLGAMALALIMAFIIYFRKLTAVSRRIFIYGFAVTLLFAIVAGFLWPSNPVFTRMENIFAGADTSAKGRLLDSFMFARDLIFHYNPWMGVGPGQVKVLAHDLIINFYKYTGEFAETVRIPNSMAEMLATYGIYGFLVKLFLEIWFFLRLKIYNNLYSLALFIFIFIYQFTGSFIVNAAELGTWALVFRARFEEFDLDKIRSAL